MFKKSLIIIALPLMLFAAEWQSLNGPPAGRADDMSIGWDPIHSYWAIYAADRTHKLYKSINEGEYWDSIYTHDDVVYPICVITEPNNAQIVYIGKYDATPVWKSSDGGGIWEPKSSGITNNNPLCFAMDPNSASIVYLGCARDNANPEMFKTTDGGTDWSALSNFPNVTVNEIAITTDPVEGTWIIAACSGTSDRGVWLSADGGNNWNQKLSDVDIYSIEFANQFIGYAGAASGVYKTEGGGGYWVLLENSPACQVNDLEVINTLTVYAATNDTMYVTNDGGASWTEINVNYRCNKALCVLAHPEDNQILFSSANWCVYKTSDGGSTWSEKTKGYRQAKLVSVTTNLPAIYTCGHAIAPGGMSAISRSMDYGQDWVTVEGRGRFYSSEIAPLVIEVSPANDNMVLFGGQMITIMESENALDIYRSTDGGENWQFEHTTSPGDCGSKMEIEFCPIKSDTVFATFSGLQGYETVVRSSDAGDNWIEKNIPASNALSLAINPQYDDTLYVGSMLYGVYKSTNVGDNWTQTALNDRYVNALAIDFDYPDTLYAGSPDGIRKTIDGGNTWMPVNDGLDYLYITDFEIDPSEPTIVYTLCKENASATQTHVYCTVDRAGKWFNVDDGLPTEKLTHDLEVDRDEPDPVYAATEQGIYTYTPDFNKSLVSSSDEATFSNSSRKMIRGGIDDFWITYESGGVIFAVHSNDGGRIWSKKMEIGYGCNPGISTDPNAKTPEPGIVWRSQNHQTLYFARHISGSNWTSPTVLQTSVNGFGPPSFVIGTDNFGRVVYSEFDGQSDKIYLYKFHIYFPFPGVPALIDEGIDPSIDFMLPDGINPEIHVAWVKSNGVWYSSKFISGTSWLNKQRIIPFGVQPCIEVCGTNVYVVCKRHMTISHRWASYANGNPTWSGILVPNFSQTATHSVYPVLTGGWSCAWTEQESDSDICFSYYDPALGWVDPINISNTTESSAHAHIVHKQTVNQTTIYFIWVEKDNAPYHIEFVSEIFGDRDKGEDYDLPFYIADGGEENASPFNLRREGYLQYGPEPYKRIDYDAQYLEYQFANLNPDREYGAGVYLYQHNSANLAISAEVDGYQIGALNLPPDTLIILRHMIPAAFYADSMIHVKIYGNNAVSAILVLYEYEIESDRGGPQSSQSLPGQAGVLALSIVPNPAKENVGVRYTLPTATSVKLSLFDVTGRLIEHVVNENQPSGTYHKSFSNINLSQGVYFVRLESDDQALVKKVIFLK